jgi:hypothetical protein
MTLPALVDEQQAIATVTQWVASVQEKMTTQASREWLETTLRHFLLTNLIDRMKVIEAADAGDEIADAALGYVFHSMMDRGETPPASMIAYEARARLRGPIKRGRGAHTWFDNWQRDIGVACLVFMTVAGFGLKPTRNREQRRRGQPSASSLVAAALGRARINIAEKRVENIWGGLAGQIAVYWATQKESPSIPLN